MDPQGYLRPFQGHVIKINVRGHPMHQDTGGGSGLDGADRGTPRKETLHSSILFMRISKFCFLKLSDDLGSKF